MSKWIAEFDLEDGDRMPEHMDLEYRGTRIDFHCKPLEQEPFINKPCVSSGVCEHDKNEVLDKLRAEIRGIKVIHDEYSQRQNDYCYGVEFAKRYVLQIIDKYKAESEEE